MWDRLQASGFVLFLVGAGIVGLLVAVVLISTTYDF